MANISKVAEQKATAPKTLEIQSSAIAQRYSDMSIMSMGEADPCNESQSGFLNATSSKYKSRTEAKTVVDSRKRERAQIQSSIKKRYVVERQQAFPQPQSAVQADFYGGSPLAQRADIQPTLKNRYIFRTQKDIAQPQIVTTPSKPISKTKVIKSKPPQQSPRLKLVFRSPKAKQKPFVQRSRFLMGQNHATDSNFVRGPNRRPPPSVGAQERCASQLGRKRGEKILKRSFDNIQAATEENSISDGSTDYIRPRVSTLSRSVLHAVTRAAQLVAAVPYTKAIELDTAEEEEAGATFQSTYPNVLSGDSLCFRSIIASLAKRHWVPRTDENQSKRRRLFDTKTDGFESITTDGKHCRSSWTCVNTSQGASAPCSHKYSCYQTVLEGDADDSNADTTLSTPSSAVPRTHIDGLSLSAVLSSTQRPYLEPSQLRVIARWMLKHRTRSLTPHHTSSASSPLAPAVAAQELLLELGFLARDLSPQIQRALKRKVRMRLPTSYAAMRRSGAIVQPNAGTERERLGRYEVVFAEWTERWLDPEWDGDLNKPVDWVDREADELDESEDEKHLTEHCEVVEEHESMCNDEDYDSESMNSSTNAYLDEEESWDYAFPSLAPYSQSQALQDIYPAYIKRPSLRESAVVDNPNENGKLSFGDRFIVNKNLISIRLMETRQEYRDEVSRYHAIVSRPQDAPLQVATKAVWNMDPVLHGWPRGYEDSGLISAEEVIEMTTDDGSDIEMLSYQQKEEEELDDSDWAMW